ncbi:MAG: phage terminase large subunit [Candidatus Obscuribacterales bacterium]|jgi:predicted phage terminase large subunit-like protein
MFTEAQLVAGSVLADEDFYTFSRWMFLHQRGYKWVKAEHHKTICDALMRVYRGECKRLIINIPPRYSKTQLCVVNFMAWTLGHYPDSEFIHTSYSGRLATGNSWQTREMVQHEAYQRIFPSVLLREDSQAKDEWRTTAGGCVYAVGAGGTITGYGAGKHRDGFGGALILDDPHKADEARSDVMRQNVIDWFQNTLESRKNSPNTPIILIMQRLHEHDLSGWLLDGGNGETWEHVCMPALRDDGTALWPAKHDADELRRMMDSSPYTFAGQYQQRPAPPEGNLFKPDNIPLVDALPEYMHYVRAWDLASTAGGGDWTVGFKLGIDYEGNRITIADIVRLRGSPEDVERAIKNTAARDGLNVVIHLPQDPGQAGKSQIAYLTKQLIGFTIQSATVSGDKITRAEPFASQCNVGNVSMLKAPWNDALINEMRMFPNSANDDQIDAGSLAFQAITAMSCGIAEIIPIGRMAKSDW